MTSPAALDWSEVAGALTFDAPRAAIVQCALGAVPARRPAASDALEAVERAIDARFLAAFGAWSSGWRWAQGEGSIGGGPVQGWCCTSHSIWAKGDTDPRATAERAASGLLDWRDWIRALAAIFAEAPRGAAVSAALAFEQQALVVLNAVMERTGGSDAWYVHAEQVLRWFLESRGHPHGKRAVSRAMKLGRFESWSTPSEEESRAVVLSMRDEVFRKTPDAANAWWRTRTATDWRRAPAVRSGAPGADALLEHIVRHDARIDETRGEKMIDALTLAREFARGEARLTFSELQRWHAAAGLDPRLREHDAFAKDGRERYGADELEKRLGLALAGLDDNAVPAAGRAARGYLDLCFLHPFADGNARAARLVLDFVITRAGLALADPQGLLFKLPLPAGDPRVGEQYLALLARCVMKPGA